MIEQMVSYDAGFGAGLLAGYSFGVITTMIAAVLTLRMQRGKR